MRAREPRRARELVALGIAITLGLGLMGAGTPKKKKNEAPPPKVEEAITDLASIASAMDIKLEGVGLVTGLDDTGVDPPPSFYRTKLVDDMRKAGIENPNKFLKDPRCSMVIVQMVIQAGAAPSDRLDVKVSVPPGCGTKSLAGGKLLQCRLREVMVLGGTPREGPDAAFVEGPVFTGTPEKPSDVKNGQVLGGGRVKKAIPFKIILSDSRKSYHTSKLVQDVVNQRFPQSDGVEQKGSAVAKDFQNIELKVPHVYHQNQDRFFRVVRLLQVVDNPTLRAQRMQVWGRQLLDPKTCGVAALRLEGIGVTAAETLQTALADSNPQVRFFAAEALAYLNDPSGAQVLAETIRNEPNFRAYGLAALAAMDQPASHITLRKLLDEPDVLVRYGAFNALRTLDPGDAFLGQVRVLDLPREEGAEPAGTAEDGMAVAIARSLNRRRRDDPFSLYLVDCDGPPLIHVARTRRCEIVIFGRQTQMLTPLVLGTGSILVNAADGDDSVEITRIEASRRSDGDVKVESGLELGEVIRRAANLGANYPEIVAILQSAQKQRNLPGPLVVDAVPGASPAYVEAELFGKDVTVKKDKPKKDDALQKAGLEKSEKSKASRPSLLNAIRRRLGRSPETAKDGTDVHKDSADEKADPAPDAENSEKNPESPPDSSTSKS
jgi:flagellar basal body P-ring protein FlgI